MSLNIVVTGANRGIGLAFCQYFHHLGHNVYGVCRKSSPELEKCAKEVFDDIDVSNENNCNSLFQKLSGVKIDILINNAGILADEILGQIDFSSIEKQFQINAISPLRITQGLLSNFHQNSKIAMITSRMGSIDDNISGGRYGYRMSKAALNIASKSLSIDLKLRGIALGIFHPGYVQTQMVGGNGDISPDEAAKRIALLIEKLDLSNSGTFWHSNGEVLPW